MQDTPSPAALSLLAMLPKSDQSQAKNQDSYCFDAAAGRFAVADGATQLLSPALFSRSLTRQFCDLGDHASRNLFISRDWQAWLQPSCQAWRDGLPAMLEEASEGAAIILQNRVRAGDLGGATFAGIEFEAGQMHESTRWRAMLIGDCCLIHLDGHGNWLASHLIQSSLAFDSRPEMFLSGPAEGLPAPAFIEGHAAQGDSFILVSDTLAKWLMQQQEAGNWWLVQKWLAKLNHVDEFARDIDELRSAPGVMDDDDITLMLVQVGMARQPLRVLIPVDTQEKEVVPPPPGGQVTVFTQIHAWWAEVRPGLTRQRVLAGSVIGLVLVAILLIAISSKSDCNTASCETATPTLAVTSLPVLIPISTTPFVSPLATPTDVPPATSTPTVTPSATAALSPTMAPSPSPTSIGLVDVLTSID